MRILLIIRADRDVNPTTDTITVEQAAQLIKESNDDRPNLMQALAWANDWFKKVHDWADSDEDTRYGAPKWTMIRIE